ncbi:MAG TPA: S1C family serine protease [Egibacteraceae bacterium]|nr:S1C family serine protease [Actinomycetota bacterium]HWB71724.1 S1C family serine protease [Egibacteraceae bacterium]
MSVLEELEQAIGRVAELVGPAVVGVGAGWGLGSGVVVSDGQVLTNAHNVRGDEVTVTFADGRTATGRVAGVDVDGDVAVVAVDTADAPTIEWTPDGIATGSAVFALANPGGRGLRVTFGLVSATQRAFRGPRGRRITGSVEHTAPLARGSSGGPVVDATGRLLGVNTNRLGEGFYLAIPANAELRARVEALARGDSPARPRLGVGLAPSQLARRLRRSVGLPERDGLLVRVVEDASPAARAGLRQGDLIVEAGGRAVASADDLHEVLDGLADGDSLALAVVRGTEELAVSVTFGPTREEGAV